MIRYRSVYDGQAKVVEYSLFEHLLRLAPAQSLLLQDLIYGIRTSVMWIQNEKLTFSQLPRIVQSDDAVSILPTSVHDRTAHFLEVFPEGLTLLDDLLPVGDVQDPAIVVGKVLDHPGDLGCPDPFPAVAQLILAAEVDAVDQLLDLGDGQHLGHFQMVLKGQPGEQALETSVSAPPTVIVQRLITVMVVFVQSFCIVFYVFILCLGLYEEMRVEYFVRSQ